MVSQTTPDERAKRVWSLGSYPEIAPYFLSMAAHLVEASGVGAGDRVLDIGCGTGNAAITAARRGSQVTGLDLVPAMLETARENAAIAGVEGIDWREGSATDLPFADDTFDVTISCVGHMFAEPPEDAAAELVRVTRSGGRIAFTCWTPESVVPAMGNVLKKYLPPDPNEPDPPVLWGDPEVVRKRMRDQVTELAFETGTVRTHVLSPAQYWEMARTESGMFIVALENVPEEELPALRTDMIETIGEYFDERRNLIPMEYRVTTASVA